MNNSSSDTSSQNPQNTVRPPEHTLEILRHSLEHVFVLAIRRLYNKDVKLGVGPVINNGFYQDMELTVNTEEFSKIETEIKNIIKEDLPFTKELVKIDDAISFYEKENQPFKVELLKDIKTKGTSRKDEAEDAEQLEIQELTEKGVVSFYTVGIHRDLCRGPHINRTGELKNVAFKLDRISGAYWRGNEKNPQLTRVYGIAFPNKDELKAFLEQRKQAEERDHRKLGKELDLFSINHETVGAGLILWHPKGAMVRQIIEDHCRKKHKEAEYEFVYTPHIGKATLWETSGHLEFYKDGMFAPIEIEGQQFYLKPMNCPFHCEIFSSSIRSYKDLPKRFSENGTVYRFERSGTLHGLTRVRGFTQDDAHLFCREDQMSSEIDRVLQFSLNLLKDFSFEKFHLYLSTRPKERVGEDTQWDMAENALKAALERSNEKYSINKGDGAFYGPKIDICVSDAIGREWQLSTIQFDFNLPVRFDLKYIGSDGKEHRPYMVHRALLGSIERFFAILVEHLGGAFPTWLAPVQALVIPVSLEVSNYAKEVEAILKEEGIRVEVDWSDNSFNKKIRGGTISKIPNLLVIGKKEADEKKVNLRRYGKDETGKDLPQELIDIKEFIERIKKNRY